MAWSFLERYAGQVLTRCGLFSASVRSLRVGWRVCSDGRNSILNMTRRGVRDTTASTSPPLQESSAAVEFTVHEMSMDSSMRVRA